MSTVTAHVNEDARVYTLAAGANSWSALLAAQGPAGLALGHVEFAFIVEAGGPVSYGIRQDAMTNANQGHSFGVGEGDSRSASRGHIIDGSMIQFWDAAGGGGSTVWIRAANR